MPRRGWFPGCLTRSNLFPDDEPDLPEVNKKRSASQRSRSLKFYGQILTTYLVAPEPELEPPELPPPLPPAESI